MTIPFLRRERTNLMGPTRQPALLIDLRAVVSFWPTTDGTWQLFGGGGTVSRVENGTMSPNPVPEAFAAVIRK